MAKKKKSDKDMSPCPPEWHLRHCAPFPDSHGFEIVEISSGAEGPHVTVKLEQGEGVEEREVVLPVKDALMLFRAAVRMCEETLANENI